MLESDVLDAERAARWGRVTWQADLPEGAAVALETRSGDSPTPSDHWSGWTETSDDVVMSPPARFLQYRLSLRAETEGVIPVVRQVSVSRQPKNRPPQVALRSPAAGDRLSGKAELKWQARDPDKDTLSYAVDISPDLGGTWTAVEEDTAEPKYDWDTSEHEDGRYLLKITASDRQSVPSDPETAEGTAVIWIDNSEPTLLLFRNSLAVDDERRGQVTGIASDESSPIRSVEYRVGDGDWRSLPLTAVESMMSEVSITTDALDPGTHTLEVRTFDAAGNLATDNVELTVEGEPLEKGPDEMSAADVTAEDQAADADTRDDEAKVDTATDETDESGEAESGGEGTADPLTPPEAEPKA
jgi:hypothetical protein